LISGRKKDPSNPLTTDSGYNNSSTSPSQCSLWPLPLSVL
jgi:hypothetical protein